MKGYSTSEASFVDAITGRRSITCAAIVDDELASQRTVFTKIALLMNGVWEGRGDLVRPIHHIQTAAEYLQSAT